MNTNYNGSNLGQKILMYILFPFGTWLYSVFNAKSRSSYLIFFLFSLLICWHMAPYDTSSYDDFIGVKERFETTNLTMDEVGHNIKAYIAGSEDAPIDIYDMLLMWFVKLFTNNYHFFFLLASIPVALCQLGTMKFLTSDSRFKNMTFISVMLLVMFIFPRDIITVQNPRFTTGFWLCVYSSVLFFYKGDKLIPWILILLAPLCHSALTPFVISFIIFVVLPKNYRVLRIIALISIPLSFFDANLLGYIDINILPPSFQVWADNYLSDDAYAKFILNEGRSGYWWVQTGFELLMKLSYIIMTIQLIKYLKPNNNKDGNSKLSLFYLYVFSLVNLVQFIPEMGSRYFWLVRVLCIFVWFKQFGFTKPKTLYLLVISCSFLMFMRYGYVIGGALAVTTSPDIFFMPLPYLIGKGLLWN